MKTVKFYKNGNTIRVMDYDDEQVVDKLAPAIYTVCQDLSGFFLSFVSERFEVPSKIYGNTKARAEKIFKTYDDRARSTGVLMTGDKGSGKTMLSSMLCNTMLERGLPVILIERPFSGTGFVELLNNIGESALLFDEFGKVFSSSGGGDYSDNGDSGADNSSQDGLLSVFDGVHTIKRLILLTENEKYKINSYMINRPGRIYYHFRYSKLEETLVRQYCEVNKIPEDIVNSILLRIDSSIEFSFDALKAVVEEYLRFNEDINDVFANLNIEEPSITKTRAKVVRVFNPETGEEFEPVSEEVEMPDGHRSVEINIKSLNKKEAKGQVELKPSHRRQRGDYEIIYIDIKDLVERTKTKSIYKSDDLLVVLEKIEQSGIPLFGKYLDV